MDNKITDLLDRGIVNIIPNRERLEALFKTDKKLNVYMGIDPTATRIHLGHAVCLRKLQTFVDLGHHVTFLIGDFTTLIGDASDKDSERPILTAEEIQENLKTYKDQAEKILDFSKIELVFNSTWLKNLKFADIIKLCRHFSVGDFVNRELIKKRLSDGKPVRLDETLYPIMQGYDSFHLDTDIQIGGADQTFNMQAGRTLLTDLANKESFVLVNDYLTGTDGRKMSKSWGNAIWISDSPEEMFGKVMSVKDDLIMEYFTLATEIPLGEIEVYKQELQNGKNPMEVKAILAEAIVSELYDKNKAREAKGHFEKTFKDREPEYQKVDFPESSLLAEVVSHLSSVSISEAKRLIKQNAVDVNGETAREPNKQLNKGDKIKIGKKLFLELS